jgi:hypothetical protein
MNVVPNVPCTKSEGVAEETPVRAIFLLWTLVEIFTCTLSDVKNLDTWSKFSCSSSVPVLEQGASFFQKRRNVA